MTKDFVKRMQALGVAGAIALSSAPVKLGGAAIIGGMVSNAVEVEAATREAPSLAFTKENVTVNGKTYKYVTFSDYDFDGAGWMITYRAVDDSNKLYLTNNLNLTPVKSAGSTTVVMHIDEYNKTKGNGTTTVTTPTTPNTTPVVPSTGGNTSSSTFKPYVQGAQGTYNNDDVNNKNNYVFPKESLLTGKYLDKTAFELKSEIQKHINKIQFTEEEAYDYIDLCFSYAAKVLGYIPSKVYIDKNNSNDNIIFQTDSASYVSVPYKTITKLKNNDNRYNEGYAGSLLHSTFWEMLRFVKEQDHIAYATLKNRKAMIEKAENVRAALPTEKAYQSDLFLTPYSRAEDDILEYANIVPFYIKNVLSNPKYQKDFQKKIDWIFRLDMKSKGVSYDGSVPATFNIAAPTLKNSILSRDKFIDELQKGASTINEISKLKNSVSDYGFYIYNIYSNPAYGMNTPNDKKVKEVITVASDVLKSSNYLSNANDDNIADYLRVAHFGTGLTPSMINEIEQKGIYSVALMYMWHSGTKTLETLPYSQEEWAEKKPIVLQTAKEVADKNKITAGNFEWSKLFAVELKNALNKKGIDITRIHESISNTEFKNAIGKK